MAAFVKAVPDLHHYSRHNLALIPMLSPTLFGNVMGVPDFHPGSDYMYAMGVAAVFTLAWVLLLIWASYKPVERKGVILLTIAPVLVGNMLCGLYAASSGFVPPTTMTPSWIVQTVIIVLLGFSYREASKVDKSDAPQTRQTPAALG